MKKKLICMMVGIMVLLTACGQNQDSQTGVNGVVVNDTGTINTFGLMENTDKEDIPEGAQSMDEENESDEEKADNSITATYKSGIDPDLANKLAEQGVYKIQSLSSSDENKSIGVYLCNDSLWNGAEVKYLNADASLCDALYAKSDEILIKPVIEEKEQDDSYYEDYNNLSGLLFNPMYNSDYRDYICKLFEKCAPDVTVTDEMLDEYEKQMELYMAGQISGEELKQNEIDSKLSSILAYNSCSAKELAGILNEIRGGSLKDTAYVMTDYEIYDYNGNNLGKLSVDEINNL